MQDLQDFFRQNEQNGQRNQQNNVRAQTHLKSGHVARLSREGGNPDTIRYPELTLQMIQTNNLDQFAGIPVTDYTISLAWYERLLGFPPAFFPTDTEAVWQLAEHRFVYIVQRPDHAGHALHMIFVDNLNTLIKQIADRGLDPQQRENYPNQVSKITYLDPDGNEFSFGGAA